MLLELWVGESTLMRFNLVAICLLLSVAAHAFGEGRPAFKKEKIKIGKLELNVEIADSPEKLTFGLMYKRSLGANEGMLFIFEDERPLSFWMKNTFVDLSVAFFNSKKELLEIKDMEAATSELQHNFPTYVSASPAQYALEMRRGWFKKNHIKVGDKLQLFIKK